MFCAKEIFTKRNRARWQLLGNTISGFMSVSKGCSHSVNGLQVTKSSLNVFNLKVYQINENFKFYSNLSKFKCLKMDSRIKRRRHFKNLVLTHLCKDSNFHPSTCEIKSTTNSQKNDATKELTSSEFWGNVTLANNTERRFEKINQQHFRQASTNFTTGKDELTIHLQKAFNDNMRQQYYRRVVLNSLGINAKAYESTSVGTQSGASVVNNRGANVEECESTNVATVLSTLVNDVLLHSPSKSKTMENTSKSVLSRFCNVVANQLNSISFLLQPPVYVEQKEFTLWSCTYYLFWPKPLSFSGFDYNKVNASRNAAASAVGWLRENNFMNMQGKPIFQGAVGSRLKLNDTTQSNIQIRAYSTTSELEFNENKVKEAVETNVKPEQIESIKSLYPAPKNVLHNCFDLLSNELKQRDLKLTPQYKIVKQQKNSWWMCTYSLKWPENIKFSEMAVTKRDASNKAALHALSWLKQNKKITPQGQPIVYGKKEVSNIIKGKLSVLTIDTNIENEISKIVKVYKNNIVPHLVNNAEETPGDVELDAVEELGEKWPESNKFKQKFMGLDYYTAKEPVELPISKYKSNLIELLKNNRALIVKGEPGCGKSTRVPQYVLEAWAQDGDTNTEPCRIIVTQPRRIAAISLAERVANEREENVGQAVGYHVRLDSNFNNRIGHIMYCTTGILLRRLQSDPRLSDCSHVILDEAHERDVNTDLLMNLLRHALDLNPNLKVLVMSATIDAKVFQDYFNGAPVLHIPGFTYAVKPNFINENGEQYAKTYKMCIGEHPYVVHEDVVNTISYIHRSKPEGAILCFLPGWEDITKVGDLIPQRNDMVVLCLHSRLQLSEQRKIFRKPPPGVRKVILATNIAETSVTIDDVVYVIDTGIHKEERFDVEKGVKCIDNHWISQASAIQRKGRAGRCQPGECFHLYTFSKYEELQQFSIPEILRTSLTKIVLDSKVYSNNMNAVEFLAQLVSPPEKSAVEKAVEELQELELLDENENLMPLGRTVSNFQLAPKLSKAMVNSVIFKCVTPIVDIATLYSAETAVFAKDLIDKEAINSVMRNLSRTSDHLAFMRLFETWLSFVLNGDDYGAEEFCHRKGLVGHKLKTLQKLRDIHYDYLQYGLRPVLPLADDLSSNNELVKAVLLSGVGTVLQHRTWDIVKGRLKNANVLVTRNNHKATITSESVNYRKSKLKSNVLLYINETVSNLRHTTLVRETSQISPLAVLLFRRGDLEIKDIPKDNISDKIKSEDQVVLNLQGTKIEFILDRRHAVAVKECKEALENCRKYYIYQLTKGGEVDAEFDNHWCEILNRLNTILSISNVPFDS